MAAIDMWIDALRKPFQKEKKIDITDGVILQLDLMKMDIQENCNGKDEELLEMIEEFQMLMKMWREQKMNHNEIIKEELIGDLNKTEENEIKEEENHRKKKKKMEKQNINTKVKELTP